MSTALTKACSRPPSLPRKPGDGCAPPLKQRSQFHLIGKPVARLDTPGKCNGSAIFGIDVVVPGMLNAAIKTARSFSGQVSAINNEADILKMPGVRAVVKLAALMEASPRTGIVQTHIVPAGRETLSDP